MPATINTQLSSPTGIAGASGDGQQEATLPAPDPVRFWNDAAEYLIDAAQRTILYWDVMRQRGNQYHEEQTRTAPKVLSFASELEMDGKGLPRPVNYGLVRIVPPLDVEIDPQKRPFVVVDPRAGHGPGLEDSRLTARSASPCEPGARAI